MKTIRVLVQDDEGNILVDCRMKASTIGFPDGETMVLKGKLVSTPNTDEAAGPQVPVTRSKSA